MFEATVSTVLRGTRVGRRRWAALGVGTRDGVLVLLLAPVMFAPLTSPMGAQFGDLPTRPYDLRGILLTGALWLPLTVRRRWPVACLAVIASAFAIRELAAYPTTFASVGLYIALYGAGAHGPWSADLRRLAPAAAAVTTLFALFALGLHGRGSPQGFADFVLIYLVLVACWGVGRAVRSWRAAEEERRRAGVEIAMARERARIARELHDVVTHHVTAMVVQADAAGFVLADAPDRVAAGLEAIGDSGRRALTDLQHLLGVLNASAADGEGDRTPVPGTLADLVEHTRAAGQPVRLTERGEERTLPSAVGLAAYRVVQEALTNALKHAPGHPTHVQVRYGEREIEVEITTDPASADPPRVPAPRRPPVRGGGHGLVGLRERVSVCGGELRAGPEPDGGFAVRARIPAGGAA